MRVVIECDCGEKYIVEGKGTFDNPRDSSEIDMYMRDSDYLEDEMIVIDCDKCHMGKIRIKL